jgi:hypothetical protein
VSWWDDRGVVDGVAGDGARTWDFFVSYTGVDRRWAEWVAWQLEDTGYTVLIQAWDFVPGSDWMLGMDQGVKYARKMIALLSPAYLRSVYGGQEWRTVLAADPEGFSRKLLPVRIEECDRPGLLRTVVGFDLFGLAPEATRAYLLEQVGNSLLGRAKPVTAPEFPVPARSAPPVGEPAFPPAHHSRPSRVALGIPFATLIGHTGLVGSMVFSPDGIRLATASDDGTVRLWNVGAGRRRATLTRHTGPVRRMMFSRAGTLLATAFDHGAVRMWDVGTGQERATLTLNTDLLGHMVFSPDGTLLATPEMHRVRLWDLVAGRERATLTGHTGQVWHTVFSPGGSLLATATAFGDGAVRLWDVSTGQERATLAGHSGQVWHTVFSPDGALLATATATEGEPVRLWAIT